MELTEKEIKTVCQALYDRENQLDGEIAMVENPDDGEMTNEDEIELKCLKKERNEIAKVRVKFANLL